MDLAVNFGKRLKKIRKQQGLTQEKLAELAGLETMSISRIECGARFPERDSIEKLIIALNCKAKDLFDFQDKEDENNELSFSRDEYFSYCKKQIGANIVKYRTIRNIKQKELASMLDITPQALSCIETGANNSSFNLMLDIARILNFPLAYFFTFDEDTYSIEDKALIFMACEAFKELDFSQRKIAFNLIKCFKKNI